MNGESNKNSVKKMISRDHYTYFPQIVNERAQVCAFATMRAITTILQVYI